ncbi:hypothetical protein BWI93_25185 [Siphonobacter sp. BAB-5385]|uniref:replication initiation protein n=1 Tax=Siphonobacter sp. BAB-5385 TaxID=1864822 RepID=UPI000B9E7904|nr:replication initiation protein [Siphonobacter sp. BAB-5385]OZI05493.1 hypothetical protein BWI93_25185 [Siphonobacter sp. BAB-5385]
MNTELKIVNAPLRETVVMKAGRAGIVEAQMNLSIHEYRVFFKMLTMVDRESTGKELLRISVSDIIQECHLTNAGYHYKTLKEAALSLMTRQIKFPGTLDGKPYTFYVSIIDKTAEPRFETDDLHFLTRFHPDLLPFILDLKSEFLTINRQYLNHLGSPYSIKLYMVLKHQSRQNHRFVTYTLEQLRFILSIPEDSYRKYGNLRQVLNNWVYEINEFTDITIHSVTETKRKRLVQDVTFEVSHKHNAHHRLEPILPETSRVPTEDIKDELFEEIRNYKITRSQFDNWIQLYGREHVNFRIKVGLRYIKQGMIRKPYFYMDSLMKNKELVEQDEVKPTVATYTLPRSVPATEAMPSPTLPLTSKNLKQQTDDLMEEYYERMNEACNNLLSVRENALDFLDYVEQLRKQTDKTIIVSMSIQNFDKERLTAETLYDYFKASNSGMMYTFKLQYFKDRHSAIWNGIRTQLQSQADQLGAKLD